MSAEPHPSPAPLWPRWVAFIVSAALFAWFFRRVLFFPEVLGYRDTLDFYDPLYRVVWQQWSEGMIPLWDPYNGGGMPLHAMGTTAVFYPGQLLFALPLSYEFQLKWYVLIHFVLALWFTYILARRLEASPLAAVVAATSYVFGGAVLFQYCNVPFACSIAWMPAAWYCFRRMEGERAIAWTAVLGVVLALMVLAGDPQAAYHALLAGALFGLFRWQSAREPGPSEERKKTKPARRRTTWLRSLLTARFVRLLAIAAGLGGLLAAVQILPTVELTRQSTRGVWQVPESIYQIPAYIFRTEPNAPRPNTGQPPHWYDTIAGDPPPPAKQYLNRYGFSLVPWRLSELVWPNISGKIEDDSRWLRHVNGEHIDIWFPSCYLGLVPLLLAMRSLKLRAADSWIRSLSWVAVLATVASFGGYGLVWAWRSVTSGAIQHPHGSLGGEVGGIYWLMSIGLPAYAGFRYPSKVFTVAALALALLAARGWDDFFSSDRRGPWLWKSLAWVAGGSLLLLLIVIVFQSGIRTRIDGTDGLSPPPTPTGSRGVAAIQFSLLHALVVATAAAALCWLAQRPTWQERRPLIAAVLIVVTGLDLAIANSWMVFTVAAASRTTEPALSRALRAGTGDVPPAKPGEFPRIFCTQAIPGERRELLEGYFASQFGCGHFEPDAGTIVLERFETFLDSLPLIQERTFVRPRRALDAWGVTHFTLPVDDNPGNPLTSVAGLRTAWREPQWAASDPQLIPAGPPLPKLAGAEQTPGLEAADVILNKQAFPRVWTVRKLAALPPISPRDRATMMGLMFSIVFPGDQYVDLREVAVVEDRDLVREHGPGLVTVAEPPAHPDLCRITSYRPDRVEIEAALETPAVLILSDTWYPGWNLSVQTEDQPAEAAPILPVNLCMRGALLPAGKHRLTYSYRPWSFWMGAAISGLTLAGLLLFALIRVGRPAPSPMESESRRSNVGSRPKKLA